MLSQIFWLYVSKCVLKLSRSGEINKDPEIDMPRLPVTNWVVYQRVESRDLNSGLVYYRGLNKYQYYFGGSLLWSPKTRF